MNAWGHEGRSLIPKSVNSLPTGIRERLKELRKENYVREMQNALNLTRSLIGRGLRYSTDLKRTYGAKLRKGNRTENQKGPCREKLALTNARGEQKRER